MPTNKVSIVPVKLESPSPAATAGRTPVKLKPICVIQANQLKISFYPGVKNYVVHTIMAELTKSES